MVKTITKNKKRFYQCEECDFYYTSKTLASKCENFCKKHKSCSLGITNHAVKI